MEAARISKNITQHHTEINNVSYNTALSLKQEQPKIASLILRALVEERGSNTSLPLPYELFQIINTFLSKAGSRNLAAANNFLYLSLNPIQIREWNFAQSEDVAKFQFADELIQFGKYLPELSRSENEFSSKQEFFEHLSRNCSDLFIFLRQNPVSINDQDESGSTILHHAARLLHPLPFDDGASSHPDANSVLLTLSLCFSTPGIDVTIRDEKGNTPVHLACFRAREDFMDASLFFVEKAVSLGFSCGTKGEGGLTILHLATRSFKHGRWINESSLLREILSILTKHNIHELKTVLNVTTDDGNTVLNMAVEQRLLVEANMLIHAGADLKLSKSVWLGLEQLKQPLEYNRYMRRFDDEVDEIENPQIAKLIREEREALRQINNIEGSTGSCNLF